ncbi:cytochrome c [Candidatus Sumerlaeota bacterium]|nr:cytochrome c [Candidatus Sumerlaeota bacterium]
MHSPVPIKKERASLVAFVVLVLLAVYFLYALLSTMYHHGVMEGRLENTYAVPKKPQTDEAEVFDQRQLMKPSDELIKLGKTLFTNNCVSCHGEDGMGDGPSGKNLNPRPRNYHAPDADWKIGTSVLSMYHTLEKGVNGMPNFPVLNPKQKYAVIHYVHATFMKERGYAEDTQAAIDALPKPGGAVAMKIDPYAETRVPIIQAIESYVEKEQGGVPVSKALDDLRPGMKITVGHALYARHCQSCHGPGGGGTVPAQVKSPLQLNQLAWGASRLNKEGVWVNDYDRFRSIVSKGQPNGVMPGFATLTDEETQALHKYIKSLVKE